MHILKRHKKIIIFVTLLSIFAACFLGFGFYHSDERSFLRLCDEIFTEELEEDALGLHFTLAFPKKYGIEPDSPGLTAYTKKAYLEDGIYLETLFESLKGIDPKSLKPKTQITYAILFDYVQNALTGYQFPYMSEPLSPTKGVHTEYPLLLCEYTFRSEEDIKDYLAILESIPSFFDGIILYEKEKIDAGLFMSDADVDKVMNACDDFSSQSSLLEESFTEKINTMHEQNIITADDKDYYMSYNERMLSTVVMPAYDKLGDELLLLKGSGDDSLHSMGLFYYENGLSYYEYLIKRNIGSDKSVPEIKSLLTETMQDSYSSLESIINNMDIMDLVEFSDPLEKMSAESILEDLKGRIKEDFPYAGPELYSYSINDVSPSLEKYTAPAYYFTPPIDSLKENAIYVNRLSTNSGIDLYTTLAHEGFPGHLYQTVSSGIHRKENDIPPIRSILHYGGFVEGYATYAEMLSYEYAKECAFSESSAGKKKNSAADSASGKLKMEQLKIDQMYDIVRIDRELKLCLYSFLDIMIHYEGASVTDVTPYLENLGIMDPDAIQNIYDYIVHEPTTYMKYYVGYLHILECKELAKKNWGSAYSDQMFHSFLTEIGSAPFSVIKKAILAYPARVAFRYNFAFK